MNTTTIYKSYPKQHKSIYISPPFSPGYSFWQRTAVPYDFDLEDYDFSGGDNTYFNTTSDQILGRELLLISGLLTGPSSNIYDETAWGFCIQYSRSLRASPGHLRLGSSVADWDDRKKGLFSESLSIGLAGYALWNYDEVVHIADAGPFIGRALSDPNAGVSSASLKSLGIYGKNGGYKPDYFCITKSGECIIVEVKGGIGPPSCVSAAIIKGKQQVKNVEPLGIPIRRSNSRIVFATNFRYENNNVRSGKDTTLRAFDPDPNENILNVGLNADEVTKSSYKKLFQFCGREDLVYFFDISNEPILSKEEIERESIQVQGMPIYPLFASNWMIIGLYKPTALELLSSSRDGMGKRINNSLEIIWDKKKALGSQSEMVILPNGVVMSKNIIDSPEPFFEGSQA